MPQDSTSLIQTLLAPSQWTLINIVQAIGVVATLIATWLALHPRWKRWCTQRILSKDLPKEFFTKEAIQLATRYYIPPYCSLADPTQSAAATDQAEVNPKSPPKLFDTIDSFISKISKEHFLWLLSDSGTGKSAFVLNYYARNRRRSWWQRHPLVVVPLGLPEVEKYIGEIKNKHKKVLFLDGFDEDTKAVDNYETRCKELLALCRGFKRLLITCRTQFFPNDQAIPRRTEIQRPGPRPAGLPGTYELSKLYLAPFTDEQVKIYLKKRYSFLQKKKRKAALALIQRLPSLAVRPMLLAYIPELLESGKTFEYTFQLYEEMVDAWLEREYPFVTAKDSLLDFSERLAINFYTNRQERGAERIARQQLEQLAKEWNNINLNEWQLSSRSLLNRDASGYYKFAHRSIMEYLFVKRLVYGDFHHAKAQRTDQMNVFLLEMFNERWSKLNYDDIANYPLKLRLRPLETLNDSDIKAMLEKFGYFDDQWNKQGRGLFHLYNAPGKNDAKVVTDYATGLMWQQSGSAESGTHTKAQEYVRDLNSKKFVGNSDWRLPTLEEAMSLMEPEKKSNGLYLDPVFDEKQQVIWTADKDASGRAWVVKFRWQRLQPPGLLRQRPSRALRTILIIWSFESFDHLKVGILLSIFCSCAGWNKVLAKRAQASGEIFWGRSHSTTPTFTSVVMLPASSPALGTTLK